MKIDIEKLESLAEAAIDQEKRWKDAGEPWPIWNKCLLEMQAAANPAAVLELITENKSGSSRLHEVAVACANAEQERDQLRAEVARLKTGYEAYERVNAELRAECEALRNRQSFSDPFYEVAGLLGVTGARPESPLVVFRQEVVPALQEVICNSRRYEWLRDGAGYCDTRDIPGMAPARMDAFIDAAMSKEQSHE